MTDKDLNLLYNGKEVWIRRGGILYHTKNSAPHLDPGSYRKITLEVTPEGEVVNKNISGFRYRPCNCAGLK